MDEQAHAGLVERVAQLGRLVGRVDRHEDRADARRGVLDDDPLVPVRRPDADAVADVRRRRDQRAGGTVDLAPQLGVGRAVALVARPPAPRDRGTRRRSGAGSRRSSRRAAGRRRGRGRRTDALVHDPRADRGGAMECSAHAWRSTARGVRSARGIGNRRLTRLFVRQTMFAVATHPHPRATRAAGQQTRRALLDAAAPLFTERGLAGVSQADIAQAAGTFPSQVTYYFGSKEALFVEAACRGVLHAATEVERAGERTRTPHTYVRAMVRHRARRRPRCSRSSRPRCWSAAARTWRRACARRSRGCTPRASGRSSRTSSSAAGRSARIRPRRRAVSGRRSSASRSRARPRATPSARRAPTPPSSSC